MSEPSDPHNAAASCRNRAGDEGCTPAAVERPASIEGGQIVDEVPTYRGEGQCFL